MATKTKPATNAPESANFSTDENAQLEAMRGAWSALRKTFEQWVVIGRGLQTLQTQAEYIGGRKTFQRLREQQGIGRLDKGIVSRLLKIMDNLPKVTEWHMTLPETQQVEWASPNAVHKHCPVFGKATSKPRPQPAIAKPENLAKVMEQQDARIEELEEEIETLKADHEEELDGRIDPTDGADIIAAAIIELCGGEKAAEVAHQILEDLGHQEPEPKPKPKKKAGRSRQAVTPA